MKKDQGKNTLLTSILMSAPGPLILGIGLLSSHALTQLADFIRRFLELLAIIMAYIIYQITQKSNTNKDQLERLSHLFTGWMMMIGGVIMIFLAFFDSNQNKGNVLSGLIIALLGVIANFIFWRRYTKLSKQQNNSILAIQAVLYRAKTIVDCTVTLTLSIVQFLPTFQYTIYIDKIGSIIVAIYLIWSGYQTIKKR